MWNSATGLVEPDWGVDDWESFTDQPCGLPEGWASPFDVDPGPLLEWAAGLPVGSELNGVLASIDTARLDAAGQIRLAVQWARVEAHACGRKLAAVAAMAGPEPDPTVNRGEPDFTDLEVGAALHLGAVSAQKLTTTARTLAHRMTGALTSLLTGRIGYLQAMQYAEAAAALTDAQCSRVEQLTQDKAESRTPWQLRQLLRKTVTRIGAEDFGRRRQAAARRIRLSVTPEPDGMSSLWAWMTSLDATIIDAGAEAYARAAKAGGDQRSLDELRVAALVDWAERYLMAPGGPRAHGRPVTINIACDLTTLLGLTAHPGEILGTGQLIPAEALPELIPVAEFRRLITDPMTGHLLDYGRSTYRFPADLAGFGIARAVTSTGPGSSVPASRCDLDHPTPWDEGGRTDRENVNPTNRRWHRAKTVGGWTVTQDRDGWTWTSPLGLTHHTSPHDYRLGP
jgi:hypothetical protein